MSLWEFHAAVTAWAKANCEPDDQTAALTDDEHDALMAKYA